MKTVWLCGALSLAMSVAGVARAEEAARDGGDPHAAAPANEPPATKRRSPGLMAGGIVLVSLGSISSIIGAAALIGQDQSEDTCRSASQTVVETGGDPFDCEKKLESTIVGASLLAGGVALLAGGIPMIVIGKERVPDPAATVSVTPRLGGASVGLTVSF